MCNHRKANEASAIIVDVWVDTLRPVRGGIPVQVKHEERFRVSEEPVPFPTGQKRNESSQDRKLNRRCP